MLFKVTRDRRLFERFQRKARKKVRVTVMATQPRPVSGKGFLVCARTNEWPSRCPDATGRDRVRQVLPGQVRAEITKIGGS